LVLASSSSHRRELLTRLALPFDCAAPNIDETPLSDESDAQTALRLARDKARTIAARRPNAIVIGSDQVAVSNGTRFGKPGDHERARDQLFQLRGNTAWFHTALCVVDGRNGSEQIDLASVRVVFRQVTDAEIETYLRREQPYDCAASAKSEGLGIALLERIDSDDPTALIGLPLLRLVSMLRNLGYPVLRAPNR